MAESPRRLDLRLTIPAAAAFNAVAAELVAKFAEYVGADAGAAHGLAQRVERSLGTMAGPTASIDMNMAANDRELVVTATSGSKTARTTCPLPD